MSSRSSKNSGADQRAPDKARATPQTNQVSLGRILRPHGIRGRVLVGIDASVADTLVPGLELFVGSSEAAQAHEVVSAEVHGKSLLVQLSGLADRTAAEATTGKEIFVDRSALPPIDDGEYYDFEVIGAVVTTRDGNDLGRVTEIIVTGANDVYVAEGPKGEILIPAVAGAVLEIDPAEDRIVVDPDAIEYSAVKEQK